MIKNLGKFKQWTGEKFGGAKVTLQTEDFQRLEQETENRREGYDNVVEAVELIQSHLLKIKPSPEDNKAKVMPFEALGSCLYHYGTVFPEDSALGIALINLGQTETRIAALQEALANDIKTGYMTTLENGLQEYKEYDSLRKKLASRRLDYDSKLNRLNKAKKEKPELEQEMQASRIKYEDTEHDLIQKMAYIQEFENEHRDALLDLVEAQCAYHNQAKELFENIKSNWGQGSTSDPRDMMGNVMARSSTSDESTHSEENLSRRNNNTSSIKQQHSPACSADDYHSSVHNYSTESINNSQPTRAPPAPSLPTRQASTHEFEKHRKALFDFTGQNDDEISFKTGDVIAVIDEIDKGWWLGEVHSKRGIFPVNYTEEYDPHTQPLPPLPARDVSPVVEQPVEASVEQQHQLYQSQQIEAHSSLPSISDSLQQLEAKATHRPPPPPSTNSSPVVLTSKSSLSRTLSTAIRPPPPPPAVKVNSLESSTLSKSSPIVAESPETFIPVEEPTSYINSAASSLHSREDPPYRSSSPLPPPPSRAVDEPATNTSGSNSPLPQSYSTESLGIHSAPAAPTTHPTPVTRTPCIECECHDFIENLFKKGYCNNCFHKHE